MNIQVLDNFLAPKLYNAISSSPFWLDPSFYWHDMNLDQSVGSHIVAALQKVQGTPFDAIIGFEYWGSTFSTDDEHVCTGEDGASYHLDIHVDKDEILHRETDEFVYPQWGAIVYWCDEVEGGEFRYWKDSHTFVDIKATSNRCVILDPSKPHGVLEVTSGIRRAITINFWDRFIRLKES